MDPQLKAQLKETIYIAAIATADAAGDTTFAAPVSRSARVVNTQETHEATDGTKYKTDVAIITEDEIPLNSRVWLPGVDQSNATLARIPRFVERATTERGTLDFFRTKL